MIDTIIFSDLISEMSCFYKRDFTPFARRTWFKYLNDRLTSQEFIYAVEQAVLHSFYMPTPEELVAVVKSHSKFLSETGDKEKERTEMIRKLIKDYET